MTLKTMRRLAWVVTTLLVGTASAQGDAVCEVARPLDGQRLLRRLSLDLRGRVPTWAEQTAQSGKPEVSEATVDAYLGSPEFVRVMRSYHEGLLWPNLDPVDIDPLAQKLFPVEAAPGVTVYFSFIRALYLRSITRSFAPCRAEPVQYDGQGHIRTFPLMENGQAVAIQEGYVEVEPYWAPGTTIKVCAFDAQTATTAPACTSDAMQSPYMQQTCTQFGGLAQSVGLTLQNSTIDCGGPFAFISKGCGCGPNLARCNTNETAALIRRSLIEQQMRLVEDIVTHNRPYTELLLTKDSAVNGYLAHYLTHQSRASFDVFGELDATSPIPNGLSWNHGDNWVATTRSGRHSGVLTTPGYLLKFQSNRGRAHRFYNAFECSSFIPSGPLPSPSEACSKREDLTQRCGCDTCHTALEPMAAHWGRFAEYGLTPLDEARYPKTFQSVCTNFQSIEQLFRCFRFYQTEAVGDEVPYQGLLRPYVFRTEPQVTQLETGPSALAQQSIVSGRFARCTVRRLWAHFMRREPTADEESTLLPELAAAFEADQYRLRGVVKRIVTHSAYRRMP